jgi:hypothetical protein
MYTFRRDLIQRYSFQIARAYLAWMLGIAIKDFNLSQTIHIMQFKSKTVFIYMEKLNRFVENQKLESVVLHFKISIKSN